MKKPLILFLLAIAALTLRAQERYNHYEILHHEMPGYCFSPIGLMQQHDGDFVVECSVSVDNGNSGCSILGFVFFKISHANLNITDTLLVADTIVPYYFETPNPIGEGNIRASLEYHEDCDSTFMRISHFTDDNLHVNPNEDVVISLCDGVTNMCYGLVDRRGRLIISYYKDRPDIGLDRYDSYFACVEADGTIRHHAVLPNDEFWLNRFDNMKEMQGPSEGFFQCGRLDLTSENIAIRVMDSLFHTNTLVLDNILSEESLSDIMYLVRFERLHINYDSEVISIGEDEILVAAQYDCDTNNNPMTAEYGVAVAKYDLRTMQLKDYVVFNDYPGLYNDAQCLGFKQMSDGSVYLLYKEHGYPQESIVAVKMGANLHVEWKRFWKTGKVSIYAPLSIPILYADALGEEKGIAWAGLGINTATGTDGLVFFILNHDGIPASVGGGIEVRPYMSYPNPAQDQLHLQYSPDVQPKQVELYDLQGRLVRSQGNAFETVDLGRLPAGTYTLRVTMQDGQTFSDMVVKE